MYTVSDEYKAKIIAPARFMDYNGTITLSDGTTKTINCDSLEAGSLYYDVKAVSGSEFALGGCYAAELGFGLLYDSSNQYSLYGAKVEISIRLEIDENQFESVPLGVFNVDEIQREKNVVYVKALDRMLMFDKAYPTDKISAKLPLTLISEACSACGVELSNTSLSGFANSSVKLSAGENQVGTYRELIGMVCEVIGAFAVINRYGKLEIKKFSGTAVAEYEDFFSSAPKLSDFAVSVGKIVYKNTVSGTSGRSLVMQANPFFESMSTSQLSSSLGAILNQLSGVTFYGCEASTFGDPALDAGDIITVRGKPVMVMGYTYNFRGISSIESYGDQYEGDVEYDATKRLAQTVANNLNYLKVNYLDAYSITSTYATIANLNATNISVESLRATAATIENLEAVSARVSTLETNSVTADYVKTNYADINLANIKDGAIKTAMIETGAVGTAQIADGSITDAKIVALTANKITAGTLSVERLEIRGSTSSLVYALNNITGALQSQNVDTLNGEILTPRTITTDKIVADAITSNEIASKTITANEIAANTITTAQLNTSEIFANSAFINAISTNEIIVGASDYAKSALDTVTNLEERADSGEFKGDKGDKGDPGADGQTLYLTCSTAASTVAKVATVQGIGSVALGVGLTVSVKFIYDNLANSPTLNVQNTGAKGIRIQGKALTSTYYRWAAGDIITFVYDGTYWCIADSGALTKAGAANSKIGSWCSQNDTTYIDGGKIYTGSITAEKIKVDTLESICAKIGGFTIDTTTLKSSGGGYTTALACYNNDSSTSRVLHCYDSAGNDTFRILRDGTVQLLTSQMVVGPTDLSNSLAVQAGHINFYYSATRVGQLGIASVNGNFRPTFDNPLGVNGHVVMASLGQYLYGGDKVLIGASTSGNVVIGNNEQTGDINIYGGKGYVINLLATSAEGTTTKAAYAYTKGIYLPNTRAIVGLSSDSAECNLLYMSSGNNVILGSTSQPGNVHIYTASGNDIKFNVDTTTVAYVDYTGLTAKSISTTGAITAAGATINGVATVNGLTVNGGATAYSLTTTYGATIGTTLTAATIICGSYTTTADEMSFAKQIKAKGGIMLTNNAAVKSDLADGASNQILLRLNASNHVVIGQSGQSGKCYMYGVYNNASSGTVYNVQVNSAGLLSRASSSRRTKYNINYDIDSEAYHKALMSFKTAEFCLIGSTDRKLGMIAEDVETACSIAAVYEDEPVYDAQENVVGYRKTGLINNYDDRAIIQLLVLEAQRKDKEIAELRREINILKSIPIEEVI